MGSKKKKGYLKLSLALSLLQHRLHLGSFHDVPLDLQLATHKQTLSVGLAADKGLEVIVGEAQGDLLTRPHD